MSHAHTFFVGESALWVHNVEDGKPCPYGIYNQKEEPTLKEVRETSGKTNIVRLHIMPTGDPKAPRHFTLETSTSGYGYHKDKFGHHYFDNTKEQNRKLKLEDLPNSDGFGNFPNRPKPGRYIDIEVDDISKIKPSSFKAATPDPNCFDCLTEVLRDLHRAGNPRTVRTGIELSEFSQKGKKSSLNHYKNEIILLGGLNENK